jgi:hypothetical protein
LEILPTGKISNDLSLSAENYAFY